MGAGGRPRAGLFFVALLAVTSMLGAAIASASKEVITYFGTQNGSGGGDLNQPRDIAVNRSGAGPASVGDVYVVDDGNHRIQRFDKDGKFVSAWGADVIQEGKPGDVAGTNPYEVCTVAFDCQAGVAVGGNTTAAGNGSLDNPQSVAIDDDTGLVYVSDRDNRRVSVYDGDGAFRRSFGFDVAEAGPGNTGTGYEICVAADGDVCKAGVGSATPGAGQFHTSGTNNAYGIAVSQPDGSAATGTVFLANSGARQVNTYNLDGTSPASFGSAANFGTNQPTKLAVDSKGIVYASDSNSGAQIDRYDYAGVHGPAGFLASIASPPLLTGGAAATAGLAVDPDSDGVGTDEDVLYVLRDPTAGNTAVQQFGPVNDPGLVAAPAAVDDTHGAAAGFTTANGLGIDDVAGKLLVSTTANVAGAGAGHRVYVLGEIPSPPSATIDPVTTFDAASATFSGQVNPNGALTGYRFEYVDDAEFQLNGFTNALKIPEADVSAGFGSTPGVVTQPAAPLDPGTLYHVRLVAKRTFSAAGATTGEVTFTTDAAPPRVGTAPVGAKASTATLGGTVDPSGQSTSYRFEYGDQGPCETNPCLSTAPADAGSGHGFGLVTATISGLNTDATYHYRLVATNATGSTEGPDRTFATAPAGGLPDERAYELVSPPDKAGSDVLADLSTTMQSSESGDAVVFPSLGAFGDVKAASFVSYYRAVRDGTDWLTRAISPPLPTFGEMGGGATLNSAPLAFDAGLSSTVWLTWPNPPVVPGDQPEAFGIYHQSSLPDGPLAALVPHWPLDQVSEGPELGAADASFEHIAFQSLGGGLENLTPDATEVGEKAYEWAEGELRLVGKVPPPGETTCGGSGPACVIPALSLVGATAHAGITKNAVSADGSRIFFSSGGDVYVRENGATTTSVSASQRTAPGGIAGGVSPRYEGASDDGGRVVFTARGTLTDSDPDVSEDLYLYDVDSGSLRLISPDANLADGQSAVIAALGISENGASVYFAAQGRLVPGQPPHAGPSIYVWHDDGSAEGVVRYVATVEKTEFDEQNWSDFAQQRFKMLQVSPNGRYLLFTSVRQIGPYDNVGHPELYRYDYESDRLECVSCRPTGVAATGDAALRSPISQVSVALGINTNTHWPRSMLDDGRVFFDSTDAILPADSNGRRDVYEWDEGQISLVSTGRSDSDSAFGDASPDGDDVYILTRDPLVGIDVDDALDVYDARVGGGLVAQNPVVPQGCIGDACQPPPASLNDPTPASAGYRGPGDPGRSRDCSGLSKRAERARRAAARRASGTRSGKRLTRRSKKLDQRADRCRRASLGAAR